MMNFVGASLKSAKNGTFLLLFIERINHIILIWTIWKNIVKKILPASHGLLKNP